MSIVTLEQHGARQRERSAQLTILFGITLAHDSADGAADGALFGSAKICTMRLRGPAQLSAQLLRDELEQQEQLRGLEWQRADALSTTRRAVGGMAACGSDRRRRGDERARARGLSAFAAKLL